MSGGDTRAAAGEDIDLDILSILDTLWRRKLFILALMSLGALAAALYTTRLAERVFVAHAVVELQAGQSQILDFGAALPGLGFDRETMNTEVEVFKSRVLATRLADRMALYDDPEFNTALARPNLPGRIAAALTGGARPVPDEVLRADTIAAVIESYTVSNLPATYILDIAFRSRDPGKAQRLANTLAEEYLAYRIDSELKATRDAAAWLSARAAELKGDLEATEAQVAAFAAQATVTTPEQLEARAGQLRQGRERAAALRATVTRDRDRRDLLAALRTAPAADRLRAANDPRLTALRDRPAAFDDRYDALVAGLTRDIRLTDQKIALIERSNDALADEIERQSQELIDLRQLQREAETTRLLYEYFLSELKETSAREGFRNSDSRILSFAVLPTTASRPRTALTILAFTLLGLLAGSVTALLRELRRSTYIDAEALELDTGLPVMGAIPVIPGRTRRDAIRFLADKPASAGAEAVRNLRTSLLMSEGGRDLRVIVNTSSLPDEGKSVISIALAQNFAAIGKRVLLIEGDIRRHVFGEVFGPGDAAGLAAVLAGETGLAQAVRPDAGFGFDILASGASSANAADLLSGPAFAALLSDARGRYDIVIVDTPPVLAVTDARIIARLADAVLVTLRWDATTRAQLRATLRALDHLRVPVSGLVLNRIDPRAARTRGDAVYGAYGRPYYAE